MVKIVNPYKQHYTALEWLHRFNDYDIINFKEIDQQDIELCKVFYNGLAVLNTVSEFE